MIQTNISTDRRVRLFRSAWMENLTFVSARVFIVLWAIMLPLIAFVSWTNAPTFMAPLWIIGGAIAWAFTEYGLHRFVFHFEPRSTVLRQAVFIIHGNHHAEPNDRLRNLMPPIVSLPVGGAVWLGSVWGFGPAGSWFFLGWMSGYVFYDLVHYACHQWPMKGRVARMLKVHHMRHHHSSRHGNYAITGIFLDRLLSTRISTSPK